MIGPRTAVTITFTLNGLLYGAWAARIPAVRDRLDLSHGQVGIALAFIAAGALVGMPLAGRAAARFGSRPATRASLALFTLASGLTPAAPSLTLLCIACAAMGATSGSLDVTMNAHGVAVERRAARPILSSFHAAFSIGALLGALAGAAGAGAGIDARVELAALAAAAALIGLTATRSLLPAAEDAGGNRAQRQATAAANGHGPVLTRRMAALGALAFFCLLCEGAAADWSAIYVDESLTRSAAVAGLAYAAFSLMMVVGRALGDRLTLRFGSPVLVRGGALVAAVGLGGALAIGAAPAALVGFACLGAGLSTIIPQVFRAAAETGDSGPAIAAASTIGYTGFLAGPPLIGALAELTSLPAALALLPALALLMAIFAPATRVRALSPNGALAPA